MPISDWSSDVCLPISALFASYFALAGVGAALLVAWAMLDHGDLTRIIPWLGAVVFAHWWTYRRAVEAGSAAGSRSVRAAAELRPVVEAVCLAAIWSSLPVYSFAMNPPGIQVVIAGAMGALIVSAIALTAVPAAAVAWIATMTLSLCFAYWFGNPSINPKLADRKSTV